jgi:hypothetical protein
MADGESPLGFLLWLSLRYPNTRFDWIAPESESEDQDDGDGGSRRMIVKCRICIVWQNGGDVETKSNQQAAIKQLVAVV